MRGADPAPEPELARPAPPPAVEEPAPPTPPSMPSFTAPEPPRAEESPTRPATKGHLRAIGPADTDGALAKAPQHDHEWNGVTPPSRRGGSGRFLTDVLGDLGFV